MTQTGRVVLVVGLALGVLACDPFAGDSPAPAADVIARVGEREITLEEFETWLAERPGANRRAARAGGAQEELDRLIELLIVEEEIRRSGLDRDPEYLERSAAIRARAEIQERELLRRILQERVANATTVPEDEVRARYDETSDRLVTSRIHLRQIVVPDRETALAVRERVLGGEEFSVLAREVNEDPSLRERAGDLGPMLRSEVPAELGVAAFALTEAGQVSVPFPLGDRWSLVQQLSRDTAVQLDFESARPRLEQELIASHTAEAFHRLIAERRKELGVEIDEAMLERFGPPEPRHLPQRARREAPRPAGGGPEH